MANPFKIAIILSAIDKASEVIDKASKKAKGAFDLGTKAAVAGTVMAAPIALATQKAIAFEGAMADVAKVANLDKSSEAFRNMGKEVMKTSTYLATSSTDVAKLYASLISGGTAQSDLKNVAKIAGEAAVAFDMSQEAAGNSFSAMRNAMGLTIEDTKKAFDATNAISNAFGGTASSLLEFMSQGGASVSRTLNVAAPQMQAFGRAMTASNISASEAATTMERFRKGLYDNKEAMQLFNNAGGGGAGMLAVFEAAKKSGDPFKWFKDHKFGDYASQMSLISQNIGGPKGLKSMLAFASDEQNYLNSSTEEFDSRMDTSEMRLKKAVEAINNLAISLSTTLLPAISKLLDKVNPIIENVISWTQENKRLTSVIMYTATALASVTLAVSACSFAFGGIIKICSLFKAASLINIGIISKLQFAFFALRFHLLFTVWPALVSATTAVWGFTAALLANPVTWVVVGIMALAAAVVWCYKNFDKLKAGFAGVMAVAKLITQVFIGMGKAIIGAMTFNPKMVMEGVTQTGAAIHSIMNGGIKKSFNAAYDASIKTSNASRTVDKAAPAAPRGAAPSTNNKTSNVFSPTINVSGSATKKDGQMISQNVVKAMKDHEANKARLAY